MRFFQNIQANIHLQPSPFRFRQNTQQQNTQNTVGQTAVQAEDGKVILDENGNAILIE